MYIPVYLLVYLSVYLLVYLLVYLFIRVLIDIFTRVFTCIFICVLIHVFQSSFICNFLCAVLWLRKCTYGRYLFSHSRVSINYVPGIYWLHASHSLVICQVPISYIPGIRWLFIGYFKRHFQILFVRNFSWILPVPFIYNFLCVVFQLRKGNERYIWWAPVAVSRF